MKNTYQEDKNLLIAMIYSDLHLALIRENAMKNK